VSSFDGDGTNYALGTEDGYVISGNIYDKSNMKRFLVGDEALTFVCFKAGLSRIHWKTAGSMGFVDFVRRAVETFSMRGTKARRCFGARQGAFIVQRDSQAIGGFIDRKERPLLLNADVVDMHIEQDFSRASSGTFNVLLKNQKILFYEYSTNIRLFESRGKLRLRRLGLSPFTSLHRII
jgi:hypothetical protein